jgi:hypothetical protein
MPTLSFHPLSSEYDDLRYRSDLLRRICAELEYSHSRNRGRHLEVLGIADQGILSDSDGDGAGHVAVLYRLLKPS